MGVFVPDVTRIGEATSNENAIVAVAFTRDIVSEMARNPPTPVGDWQDTAVSDRQLVLGQVVCQILATIVVSCLPKLDPSIMCSSLLCRGLKLERLNESNEDTS